MIDEPRNRTPLASVDEREIDQLSRGLRQELSRRGVDPPTIDDLVQEAWLRTLLSPPEAGDPRRLGGWLRVVGRRLVAETWRSRVHRRDRELAAAREPVARADATPEEHGRLRRMVEEQPEPYREVLLLRYFEGLSVDEIARALDRAPLTVRSQVTRGLERLRARVGTEHEARRMRWALVPFLPGLLRRGSRARLAGLALGAAAVAAAIPLLLAQGRQRAPSLDPAAPLAVADAAGSTSVVPVLRHDVSAAPDAPPGTTTAPPAPTAAAAELLGVVRNPDGRPVAGAAVRASGEDGAGALLARTDRDGRFRLAELGDTRFLWAEHPTWSASDRVYLPSLREGEECVLTLARPGGSLAVRVLGPDGRPVAGVTVALDAEGGSPRTRVSPTGALEMPARFSASARTGTDGRATLLQPDGGSALLDVRRDGRLLLRRTVALAGGAQQLLVDLPRPTALRGLVLGPGGVPAPDAFVVVRQLDDQVYRELHTGADGRFLVEDMLVGAYSLTVLLADGRHATVAEGTLGDGETADLVLATDVHHTLHGVVLEDGRPVAGAHVRLYWSERLGLPLDDDARTDADGRFALAVGARHTYRLDLCRPGEEHPDLTREGVRAGEELRLDLAARPPESSTVAVELVGSPGRPLPALLALRRERPRTMHEVRLAAGETAFSATLPAGEYRLYAWIPGVGVWRHEHPLATRAAPHRVVLPRPEAVVLASNEFPGAVRARILRHGFNPFGREDEGAVTTVLELAPHPDGTFRAELLPGRYRAELELADGTEVGGVLRVVAGGLTAPVAFEPAARGLAGAR